MIYLTKKIEFEAAHRISNYPGTCSEIHGHTYYLEVTVSGKVDWNTDMVLDFKILKSIIQTGVIDHFDHALILKRNSENEKIFSSYPGKIAWMESEPTAEQMLLWIVSSISPLLPDEISLAKLKLHETSGSWASWKDNKR
ncbi:MAG: 6-carboxytetrahydropterin synthase QueD [Cyclobacterium sp.]|nr:6-carboxytetrahydropterin synthase QueD [Cyclobacterium sp.]